VNFNLDLNGMLKVTAIEKDTGLKKSVTLDTRGARPSLDLEKARKNIESLVNPGGDAADNASVTEAASEGTDASQDHEPLLRSARDLRKRGEGLLTQGISEDDATEVRDLLKQSADAISERNWEQLQDLNDTLSDLIFYLED
jgi:molecular chaperone DnaK